MKQTFSKIRDNDINENTLKKFKKIRQWPHLTLMLFPKHNNGSCHDYTILNAMLYDKKQINYKLDISTGTNTLLSHVTLRKTKYITKIYERKIRFILLSLFHTFRTHQTLKFITKSTKKMRKLENLMYSILMNCLQNEKTALNLMQYLLTRRHNSYVNVKV
jgi:hypothetical protein